MNARADRLWAGDKSATHSSSAGGEEVLPFRGPGRVTADAEVSTFVARNPGEATADVSTPVAAALRRYRGHEVGTSFLRRQSHLKKHKREAAAKAADFAILRSGA